MTKYLYKKMLFGYIGIIEDMVKRQGIKVLFLEMSK